MKTRNGFVSNSSSSSFCIIGVDSSWVQELAKAEKKRFECFYYEEDEVEMEKVRSCDCDIDPNKGKYCPECGFVIWYEREIETKEGLQDDYLNYGVCEGEVVSFYGYDEPLYAGVDAETLLETMSVPEACKSFQKTIKKEFDLDIPLKVIGLHYGECGNG